MLPLYPQVARQDLEADRAELAADRTALAQEQSLVASAHSALENATRRHEELELKLRKHESGTCDWSSVYYLILKI